ncbi:MAG TPA: LLM class flavin-dependent oxidoreductase [Polyangiaceae bacterium]|jgi:luciferase family oxidoreductase group 1|nr:LLM class flavin-dependent oxidoreductase [Polyangiaceae bacterium]
MVPLSVLDLYPVSTGSTPTAAIHDSVALARRVDELGYERYWIAEHHNMPSIASSAPEVLIGYVAGQTRRIRVGAGGIMLPNHAPLHVLEVFRTLEALYPGRIDLGIGRAPGTDPVTSSALRRKSSSGGEVNDQIAELFAFADRGFPSNHPYGAIDVMPADARMPPLWMLGSTSAGANIAATLGAGFAFAGHFSMGEARGAVAAYRSRFQPSERMPEPRLIMAVTVICGESDEHARDLAAPLRVVYARLASGKRGVIPTVEEARRYPFTSDELLVVERFSEGAIVGSPTTVRAALEGLVERTTADELMISTLIPDARDRVRSYERLAEVWGLGA